MLDDAVPSVSLFRHCSSFIAHNPLFFRYCTQNSPSISAEFTVFLLHRTPNSISYHFMYVCVWVCECMSFCVSVLHFQFDLKSTATSAHAFLSTTQRRPLCCCTVHQSTHPPTNTWYCFDWPAQSTLSTIQPSIRHNHDQTIQPTNQTTITTFCNQLFFPFSVLQFPRCCTNWMNASIGKKKLREGG